MTNQHPITPSPELIAQCIEMFRSGTRIEYICGVAAQWGADRELDACCGWLDKGGYNISLAAGALRRLRRPKPPSLKEQALDALRDAESSGCLHVSGRSDIIRRALEALPNDN